MSTERSPASRYLTERWDSLSEQYPLQWVAATSDALVFVAEDLSEVIAVVDSKQLDTHPDNEVAFAFLDVGEVAA